ncbi:MAG: putative Zn-dependent protease [Vicingaceae bacterium]|jgi:predicted Zn-dependent protease
MKKGLLAFVVITLFAQCATVPITGRRQMKFVNSKKLQTISFTQYSDVKTTVKLLPNTDQRTVLVKNVGEKISVAVNRYLTNNGYKDRLKEFEWEFNLADENTVNAWCMPGGKVMFYTGILPICEGEDGIAVVMGHEIAHAIARHGNERMSQGLLSQGLGVAGQIGTSGVSPNFQAVFNQSFGIGSQLGLLKFSRNNESEADKLGLVFMTMAGYNPATAVEFWKRMAANKGNGQKPPEFMSTHPSDDRRIADIQEYLPEARNWANK